MTPLRVILIAVIVMAFLLLGSCGAVRSQSPSAESVPSASAFTASPPSADNDAFCALGRSAKTFLAEGKSVEAAKAANDLLRLVTKFPTTHWNYGNAIQDGNLVLGRIALNEGNVAEATRRLAEMATSPGSPQMNSFGPNVSLAKALLEHGQRDAVIAYFTACKRFWKMDDGKLDRWIAEAKSGTVSDFGANLVL